MKKFLVIFLLLSTCSVVDEEAFYSKVAGYYSLNSTGARFLKKVTGDSVVEGDTLRFSGNTSSVGTLAIITYTYSGTVTTTNATTIATLVGLKKSYQGVFKFEGLDSYVAMGLEDDMWISTTNTKSSPDDVLFEHLVPIATSTD